MNTQLEKEIEIRIQRLKLYSESIIEVEKDEGKKLFLKSLAIFCNSG